MFRNLCLFLVVFCAVIVVLPRAAHAQIQFASAVSYDVGTSLTWDADSLSSADFNGDGFPDVAVPTLEGVSN